MKNFLGGVDNCYLRLLLLLVICGFFPNASAQQALKLDSTSKGDKNIKLSHQLTGEIRGAYVFPSAPFYRNENANTRLSERAYSAHLKYSFSFPNRSFGKKIFSNTSQGLGLAYFDLGNTAALGNPVAAYLFQNAELLKLNEYLGLNYEWNFGLSSGWHPFDENTNAENMVIGSKVNAYISLGVLLNWKIKERLWLSSGFDVAHFSNGNTTYPNAGFNLVGAKLGVTYDLQPKDSAKDFGAISGYDIPQFIRFVSYDVVVFGSWRRKGVEFNNSQVASPEKYPVLGAYVAPMYNFGHRFRAGASLDFLYDESANVYTEDYIIGTPQPFYKAPVEQRMALGLSARADFIMPIFTISFGVGKNVLYQGNDFSGTYQSVALKTDVSRNIFLHFGYSVRDFHEPNYLMLGLGYRFGNKAPSYLRF